ncbi:MAG: radical SAM protein [Nitrospirota bacterium]|nr:radical SAM protein [Nitrospirota bacterium]
MNIALIIPPSPGRTNIIRMIDCSHEAKANYLWQPNDFMIITSRAEPDDDVQFVDGTADALDNDQFLELIDAVRGDLVIIALSSVCWESDYAYFLKVKERFAAIPLYVLGDIFLEEAYRRHILEHCDGIIVNPYVLDLRSLATQRKDRTGRLSGVCITADGPLFPEGKRAVAVTSSPPRHELFQKTGYRFPFAMHVRFTTVTTMWGCPFTCTYCSDSKFPPILRSYEDVLRELVHVANLGIREIFFADKVFGFNRKSIDPLLATMRERFSFSWSCYFHPQLCDRNLLQDMKAAGCHTIIIGVDSADVRSLKRYRRYTEREQVERVIAEANDLRIDVCADFILGLEHEDEADILRTIEYALEIPIDFASFNIAAPLPGSDIRRSMNEAGVLKFGREGFDTCGRSGILGNRNITARRLRELRKTAFRRFYLRPSYLLRRLRRTRSVEHLLIQVQEMISMIRKI